MTVAIHDFLSSRGRLGRAILFLLFMEDLPTHLVWGDMHPWQVSIVAPVMFITSPIISALAFICNVIPLLTPFGNLVLFSTLSVVGTLEIFHVYYDRPREV